MKTNSKLWLVTGVAVMLVTIAGCSGDSGGTVSGSTAGQSTVPDSAGTTVASFMAYLMGLDANDERSEPLLIKDSFAMPPDEGNDAQPLT